MCKSINGKAIDYEAALKAAEEQKMILQAEIARLNKELEENAAALRILEEQGKQEGA